MKNVIFVLLSFVSINAFASDCTINTYSLHVNDTEGTRKIEKILSEQCDVVTEKGVKTDYLLELRYFGNYNQKELQMLIFDSELRSVFSNVEKYSTPFGIEGGIFERVHAVRLAKNAATAIQYAKGKR